MLVWIVVNLDSLHVYFSSCMLVQHFTENKEENYLEIYTLQVSCPLSLPLLIAELKDSR